MTNLDKTVLNYKITSGQLCFEKSTDVSNNSNLENISIVGIIAKQHKKMFLNLPFISYASRSTW